MTTDSWIGGTGSQLFGTEGASDGNWSTGKVPGSSNDVVISTASATTVASTSSQDVSSIELGSNDTLSVVSDFQIENGTGASVSDGTVNIESNGELILGGGTFDSDGTIELNGTSFFSKIELFANTDLDGPGTVELNGSGNNSIEGDVIGEAPDLISSEDIIGSGLLGDNLSFTNNGTVETGSNGKLEIYGTAGGGSFVNNATVKADNGGELIFGGPGGPTTISNNDIVELDSTGSLTELQIGGAVTVEPTGSSGNGIINLTGTPGEDAIFSAGSGVTGSSGDTNSLTLINETLKGAGTVGDSNLTLNVGSGSVINADDSGQDLILNTGNNTIVTATTATIEANGGGLGVDSPIDNAGTISASSGGQLGFAVVPNNTGTISALDGGSIFANLGMTNDGTVEVDNGGVIYFGDGTTRTVSNNNNIELDSTGSGATLEVNGTVHLTGGGMVELNGTVPSGNAIVSYAFGGATLDNEDNTVVGAGQIGDGSIEPLTVDNEGTFDAIGQMLFMPSTCINDGGTLEATDGGNLDVGSGTLDNAGGTVLAASGGTVNLEFETITGSGSFVIGQNSELFAVNSNLPGNIHFSGPQAKLDLSGSSQLDGATISGAVATDTIALNIRYTPALHAVWQQTTSSGGTLSLYSNGADLASLSFDGDYSSLNFTASAAPAEGGPTTLITIQNTPTYADNPGNNDEWILSDGNWVESAGPGSHPSGYNVVGIGDWTGSGTDGILWFNPSTGDTDEWQLSNTQWLNSVDLGSHPGNYQIAGVGDFFGNGISDVLWTSASGGSVQTDIWQLGSNGQWINSVSPGPHPAGYSVAGTGDWTGDGTDGILWYNASTGDTDEWQLSGGQWANSVDLGSHPGSGWTIAGVGDFFGNGISDVLWTNASGGTVQTDIWELGSNGQWINSVSPGNHPAGYQVAAVGDFTGNGTSDILWYSASTGDVDEWLINNGQWANSIDLGTHPGNFQIAGVGDFTGTGTNDILWHAPS